VLRITTRIDKGFHVITVCGNLDQLTSHRVGAAVADGSHGLAVIFDLRNSSAADCVDAIHGLLRGQTTPTALVCAPGCMTRLLEQLSAQDWVPICTDIDTAMAILTIAQVT
jgi:hypothetical protein